MIDSDNRENPALDREHRRARVRPQTENPARSSVAWGALSQRKNTQASITQNWVSTTAATYEPPCMSIGTGKRFRTSRHSLLAHSPTPCSAMPQPAEQHRDHQIAADEQRAAPVAAERDVQVIA